MTAFFRKDRKHDKSTGDEFFARGQWAQALRAYEAVLGPRPDNVKLLRRVADLRAKVGRKTEAVEAYRSVADLYAQSGFLVQAIAIQKILLRLDPEAEDVGRKLAELYARRGLQRTEKSAAKPMPEIPLFSDLDPEAFREVLERVVPRSLPMGAALFREGDPGDSIYVVTAGAVRVSRGDLVLAELGEGEFFGEGAFFSHEPRNADVTAVAPTELLEIRGRDLQELMAQYPGVAVGLTMFYKRRVLDGVLAGSPHFGCLSGEERRRVADLFRIVNVAPGEVVIRQGATDRTLFLVKRGRFAVTASGPAGGEPVLLAELGPGQLFGEVALVSKAPRTASVAAVTEGEVLRVEGDDLGPVLERNPQLGRALEETRDQRAADAVATLLGRNR